MGSAGHDDESRGETDFDDDAKLPPETRLDGEVRTTADDPLAPAERLPELPEALRTLLESLASTPGTTRLRRDDEIGRGGMGRVYLAHDDALRRRMALKVLAPRPGQAASRIWAFLREAQIMAQLDHPNIPPIHDLGVDEAGRLHFSMKLMTGRTFHAWIESFPRRPYLPHELIPIIEVTTKICDALAFAHSRGVIHCDVTPRNVMVGDFGEAHLMDWGLARCGAVRAPLAADREAVSTTSSPAPQQRAIGTPAYMSPELAGAGLLDERSDVFQVGGLLYFALTRSPPYTNCGPETLLRRIMEDRIDRPAEVAPWARIPSGLERIVLRAMAKAPDERFQTIAELRAALTNFMWGGEAFDRVSFAAGTAIIEEGAMGDCAYILASGTVQVFRTVRGERVPLRTMTEGEVIGEMALITRARRSASVVALTDCEAFVVDRETLERELEGLKPWMGALTRALALRLKQREDEYLESTLE